MNKTNRNYLGIFSRYIIILLLSLSNLYIFYFIFTPLTIYSFYYFSKIFFDVSLNGNILYIGSSSIELIGACIAGSAYYLLLTLNLSTPRINIKKRILMIFSSFLILLIANVLRIFFLMILFINNFDFFDITHKIFWYLVSTILVVLIWIFEVKIFKLKDIPFYSDLNFIFKNIKK